MTHSTKAVLDGAGPTVSIGTAAKALGISRAHCYALADRGELGMRVLRLGKRWVVPTVELRRALGLHESGGEPAA